MVVSDDVRHCLVCITRHPLRVIHICRHYASRSIIR
jgi:hypothetical protein